MNGLPPLRITTAAPVGIANGAIKNGSLPSARDGRSPFLKTAGPVGNRRLRRFIRSAEVYSDPVNHRLRKSPALETGRFRGGARGPLSSLLEEERMSRREEMNDKVENAGIAQALAELIEKNHAQAAELEALARLVETATAAAQEREAAQAARLGEVLGELAEAVAAVEIEKQKRSEAEETAAELISAVDDFKAALARFPSATRGSIGAAADDDRVVAAVQGEATPANVPPTGAAPGDETPDGVAPESDWHGFAGAEPRTVSIVVNLSPAEAEALETLAARDGNGGSVDAAAARLIRDGLRRSGWTPAADENRSRRE